MKGWVMGLIGAGATAVVGMISAWALGVFSRGVEAIDEDNIGRIISAQVLDEEDIKRILAESMTTANGQTLGQIAIATKEEVIVLRTKVELMERALNELTR